MKLGEALTRWAELLNRINRVRDRLGSDWLLDSNRVSTPWRKLCAALAALSTCALLAACGSGGASGPQSVSVSLLAPTDGASVKVHKIYVVGSVDPRDARVTIAGQRVRVLRGGFKRSLLLARRLTRIRIVASAPGYLQASTEVAVRYSPDGQALPARHGSGSSSFTTRVDRLCAAENSAVTALPTVTSTSVAIEDLRKEEVMGVSYLRKLRAITPPRSLAADYAAVIEIEGRAKQFAAKSIDALQTGNIADLQSLYRTMAVLNTRENNLLIRLGLPTCAMNVTPSG